MRGSRRPFSRPLVKFDDCLVALADRIWILEYKLNVELVEIVSIMKNMRNTVIWPRNSSNRDPKGDNTW